MNARHMTGEEVALEILRRAHVEGSVDALDQFDDLFYPVVSDTHVIINLSTGEDPSWPRSPVFDLVNMNDLSSTILLLGEAGDGRVPGNNESEHPDSGVVLSCYITGIRYE